MTHGVTGLLGADHPPPHQLSAVSNRAVVIPFLSKIPLHKNWDLGFSFDTDDGFGVFSLDIINTEN